MFVIGTAGHVDHGKSTLVKALTGIDPDRLPQEKEREMTIDLGFAWLALPGGPEVSIVDVPGHERFIKNMLAGVGGIDLALLVVAADEGVMPQTLEHLAILDLLQVKRGVVAVTKSDLVDQEFLELVLGDVEEALKGTSLEGAPLVVVSAFTGQGLEELKETIARVLEGTEPRRDLGRPRLPIDRSFTVAGFGTVVTGTLIDGTLSIGQEVELVPSGRVSRIRGLQTHRKRIEKAAPGSRVAVNLSGVSHSEVRRGEVLTNPGWLRPTAMVDVHLRLIPGAPKPLRHNEGVTFHAFTSETLARVRLLDREELRPGQEGWGQVHLTRPLPLVRGDFFVIRSPETTLGGGRVVDPYPRRHRRFHPVTLERLRVMGTGSPEEVLLKALDTWGPSPLRVLAQRANLPLEEASSLLSDLASQERIVLLGDHPSPDAVVCSASFWASLRERARGILLSYHREHPLRRGMPKEELRSRLGQHIPPVALARLVQEGALVEEGRSVRLPEHRVTLSPAQEREVEEYIRALEGEPYSPPTDRPIHPELLSLLVEEGRVVKVSETVVFTASAYREMVERVVGHIRERGKITVGEVRDMFRTSRKYALALLEYLDQQHITRRVGDERVLR